MFPLINVPIPSSGHFIPLVLPHTLPDPALLERLSCLFLFGTSDRNFASAHPLRARTFVSNPPRLFISLGFELALLSP